MKKERELIKLAGQKVSVDDIAAKMKTNHITVRRVAERLRVNLGPQPPRPDGRFKAKPK